MKNKRIEFTIHAEDRLRRLISLGVTKEKILEIVRNPEKITYGRYGRKIAQGLLTSGLMLKDSV